MHLSGARAGAAGDVRGACGVEGFGKGYVRQEGGAPAGQHRRAFSLGLEGRANGQCRSERLASVHGVSMSLALLAPLILRAADHRPNPSRHTS